MITLIAAVGLTGEIGKANALPWDYPEDLKHFRRVTSGKTVVMGRKTFESIGRPLPNRKNIVLSRTMPETEGITIVRDMKELLRSKEDLMIIGGEEIYFFFIDYADKLIITEIPEVIVDADAYFPAIRHKLAHVEQLPDGLEVRHYVR